MSDRSNIEWTQATWNPVTGCTKVSPGCDHCYAETFAERFRGVPGHPYEQGFDLRLWPNRLETPLRWRRPRIVFVNSMSDLFQDAVPVEFISEVFDVMERTPQHTYQVLTKRPGRMASIMRALRPRALPNVWLGTSVETQRWAEIRIPKLLKTPAEVRFLSCEPLLARVDLHPWAGRLDWVIVGGESGPGARPMDLAWARRIVSACNEAGTAVFVKQLGKTWSIAEQLMRDDPKGGDMSRWPADLRRREMPAAM